MKGNFQYHSRNGLLLQNMRETLKQYSSNSSPSFHLSHERVAVEANTSSSTKDTNGTKGC